MNIAKLIEKNAATFSEKPAFFFKEDSVSSKQFRDIVFALANGLSELGVRPKDKVGIYLPNWPEYIYSYLALFCLGATAVPLDYMLTEEEMGSCLNHCGAKLLIAKAKDNTSLQQLKSDVKSITTIVLLGGEQEGFVNFDALLSDGSSVFEAKEINDDDLALIMYTSGTTGKPKGIMLSYKHLSASVNATHHVVGWSASDVLACVVPFSHIGGLMGPLISVWHGVALMVMERFIPLRFLQAVERYKVSCFYLVPSMYYAILHLKEFETYDLSSIRFVNVFGAPNAPEVLRRFHQYCPKASFLNGWGLTETNGPVAITPLGEEKLESVGKPMPWVEVKIVDDTGSKLPAGSIGEIMLKSWVLMKGYYKDEEETRHVLRDGWFATGDLGKLDKENFLYIVGRKKEVIKVAGELVHASEVETVLSNHPQVEEVAVIGIADELRGEAVKAVITLKENASVSAEEIRYFAKEHLAHFKVPHVVEFMEHLPKNRTGKIDKTQLQ